MLDSAVEAYIAERHTDILRSRKRLLVIIAVQTFVIMSLLYSHEKLTKALGRGNGETMAQINEINRRTAETNAKITATYAQISEAKRNLEFTRKLCESRGLLKP